MAHVRRGRMGLGTHNAMNTAAVGKGVTAAKNGSVVDLKRNVLGGGIAKRIVTRATLKTGLIHIIDPSHVSFNCFQAVNFVCFFSSRSKAQNHGIDR